MSYQTELQRLVEAKASMRQSIINKGVEVPEDTPIEDYPTYIAQIAAGNVITWDPDNPTLEGLKSAIDNDIAVATGTEIPDTYNGQSNPLIVAQKLDSSNNSKYDGAEGVILVRKYLEPASQTFGSTSFYQNAQGVDSSIKNLLDTTYYNNCSADLKAVISDINIPYYNGSTTTSVASKWFLMSATEVCAKGDNTIEGFMWDYWKQKTGLSSLNNSANAGRIMRDRNGNAQMVWLRSRNNATTGNAGYYVDTDGTIYSTTTTSKRSVLPACFIAKGGN